jgi:hypothetical protein
MGWTTEQQNRLNKEWEIVQQYFPQFQFKTGSSRVCLEGNMRTNSKRLYGLRLYVPDDMPNSVPDVVVTYPYPLVDFAGKNLSDYSFSSTMHLLSPKDGYPRVCTYKSTFWNPNRTFYNVLMKVRVWLEA